MKILTMVVWAWLVASLASLAAAAPADQFEVSCSVQRAGATECRFKNVGSRTAQACAQVTIMNQSRNRLFKTYACSDRAVQPQEERSGWVKDEDVSTRRDLCDDGGCTAIAQIDAVAESRGLFDMAGAGFVLLLLALPFISSIWVFADAQTLKDRGASISPAAWILGCFVAWPIAFPWYLRHRGNLARWLELSGQNTL